MGTYCEKACGSRKPKECKSTEYCCPDAKHCLTPAFADDAVHCIHLDDFDCYSRNGYCLSHESRPCAPGTVCDHAMHKKFPGIDPCVDPTTTYKCNPENKTC